MASPPGSAAHGRLSAACGVPAAPSGRLGGAAVEAPAACADHLGKIGPNAIIRVIEALNRTQAPRTVHEILATAGLEAYLTTAPGEMIDAGEAVRLHIALRARLGDDEARRIGRSAGALTADYLLRRRIPKPAQILLHACPPAVASRLLARAIRGAAWTFVGGGAFSAAHGRPTHFTIRNCPMCSGQSASHPSCDFYAGTFERLYDRLVLRGARVLEIECQAMGASACVFEITW